MRVLLYLLIFVGKITEVSFSTVRIVLVNRGERIKGAVIAVFEVLIWLLIASSVLNNITADPIKIVVYCLGFACGNYLGVTIEGKLAIGNACIWSVVSEEHKSGLENELRSRKFGVTVIEGEGINLHTVYIFMIYLRRKQVREATDIIHSFNPDAFITVNDVRMVSKGYIRK